MLVKAMEVSGIEGNFRSTCENVMQVLRTNKDSVMAMMEVKKDNFPSPPVIAISQKFEMIIEHQILKLIGKYIIWLVMLQISDI